MKKISISQIPSAEILSAEEMKLLLGGIQSGSTGCESYGSGNCSGKCKIDDHGTEIDGECAWGSESKRCNCTGATIGE